MFGVEGDVWVATQQRSAFLTRRIGGDLVQVAVAGVNGATAVGFGAPARRVTTYPSVVPGGL